MSTLKAYCLAAAEIWGAVILVALIISLSAALIWWTGRGLETVRIKLARRRFTREALAEARLRQSLRATERRTWGGGRS